jgi:DNA-binding transcriptional MerR regulator
VTTYSTRDAAKQCGLTPHTLRWYERIGLLDRVSRGSDGRRRFSDGDLDWLRLLVRLRGTGMPVAEMQRYAELVRAGEHTRSARRALLVAHRQRVREQIVVLQEHATVLDMKIDSYQADVAAARESA